MKKQYFQQPSVMSAQQHFSQVPSAEIQRSTFDRSHGHTTTFDAGKLIPIFVDEVLPGDTFRVKANAFCRLATPKTPLMDNIYLDIHFFFVPNRLVYENWAKFMGERPDPDFDPNTLSMPQRELTRSTTKPKADDFDISHYFGLPYVANGATTLSVNALPFRAYNLIWNEWYRDQNLQDRRTVSLGDGPDTDDAELALAPRGKRHDYFTSCLPWPQKGDPVVIPLGQTAEIDGLPTADLFLQADGTAVPATVATGNVSVGTTHNGKSITVSAPDWSAVEVDLSSATAVSINDLRSAFQIQRLLERDARGGTRYIELILSHFGVRSDDARLQRPEYLGGGSTRVNINPVASTIPIWEGVPQGYLTGFGTAIGDASFNKSFTEHGFVIGLASARADLRYQRGVDRMWSRKTRVEHYWPALAHLGEQGVLNKEIYYQGTSADDEVFGYQERFAEYRYKQSRITGLMNSDSLLPLDLWHVAQEFDSLPVLNSSFIEENPPIDRVISVPSEPHFLADIWFNFHADRPMPVYSVPGLIDHF